MKPDELLPLIVQYGDRRAELERASMKAQINDSGMAWLEKYNKECDDLLVRINNGLL